MPRPTAVDRDCRSSWRIAVGEDSENAVMDITPSGKRRRDAVSSATAKVEAALASREEAAKLRERLLKMIVENEMRRRQSPTESTPSPTQV